MPPFWSDILMQESLTRGGLVLLAAVTGQGKSTTLAATVKSRLQRYAGFALTIEDPIELPLHGVHGDGTCVQTEIEQGIDTTEAYARAMRRAMRSFPAIPNTMMVLGEVRDAVTATDALRAAINGHLVLTTVHADSIEAGLKRLEVYASQSLGSRAALDLIASATRVVIHQELRLSLKGSGWTRGRINGEVMLSPVESNTLPAIMREGRWANLATERERQANLMRIRQTSSWESVYQEIAGSSPR